MNLEETKIQLKFIDSNLVNVAIEIYERNLRLGFPNSICIFSLFLPYLKKYPENQELNLIIEKNVENAKEKIKDLKIIFDVENLNDNIIKEKVLNNDDKIFDVLLTKIIDVDLTLAIMSEKITLINKNEYFPDKNTFTKFIEKVYLPLTHVLGIYTYTTLFDDFIITNNYPKEYKEVLELTKENLTRSKDEINYLISKLEPFRKNQNEIIDGRLKSPTSVFKKIYERKQKPNEIMDYVAIRIITNTIADCYSWLGKVYSMWEPELSRFKDYIEHPKPNGYKSLHIVINTKFGPVEIQIRTFTMHKFAELGIAAHWQYKTKSNNKILLKINNTINSQASFFGKGYVFAYTPKKDIILLEKGASIVDFAYAIHTSIGSKISYAKVNNIITPLDYKIQDKDLIEIFTDENKKPSKKWLEFVITNKARDKICQMLNIKHIDKKTKEINPKLKTFEKISVAKCCNPFIDDEVGIYKTTKRKLILHNIKCLEKNKLKYAYAGELLKKELLISKNILITYNTNTNISEFINKLKTKLNFSSNYNLNELKKELIFSYNFNTSEEYEKLKEELLKEEHIETVELI